METVIQQHKNLKKQRDEEAQSRLRGFREMFAK